MALILADRVKQESTTTGTGAIAFSGGVDGFQLFSAVCSTNDTMYYVIQDKIGTNFEIGHGTFNASGQIVRTNILQSSNSDNVVNFGAGTKEVFITYPADKAVFQNFDGSITIPSTIDGRDLVNDGNKLDGIETNATQDQTASQIRSLVESASDSNVFSDADHSKLNAIEASATADQTKSDIDALNIDADTLDGQHGSYYTGYADTAVSNLVDSSPSALNTLNELAAALGDDANFSTTVNSNIATKLPLAGGTMTGNLTMGANELFLSDNGGIRLGDSEDLQIVHDGTDSIIKDHGAGALEIRATDFRLNNSANSKNMIKAFDGGSVQLFHNNVKKLETTADGITMEDNQKVKLGNASDLEIYHNGSHSFISNSTGDFNIINDVSGSSIYIQPKLNENAIKCDYDGAVRIYHDNTQKFQTTTAGTSVSGNIAVSGTVDGVDIASRDAVLTSTTTTANAALPKAGGAMTGDLQLAANDILVNDGGYAYFGNSNDLKIGHDGSNSVIQETGAGDLYIDSDNIHYFRTAGGGIKAKFIKDGAVELYYSGGKKFETASGGVSVTGTLTATTLTGNIQGNSLSSAQVTNALGFTPPSSDTNTTYSAGTGMSLSGTTFNCNINTPSEVGLSSLSNNGNSLSGSFTASGNITAYSSRKLKSDIKTIDNALDKVSQMRGVTFTKDGELSSGVIAEEFEEVAPELVLDGEYKSVAYGNTVGYLIEAIKELKAEVEELKSKKNCECE